ncbi:hypothetical protein CLAFUW4_13610 [Fulvia fulva]|uniref:Uncharacterized protein n=1 Tax=Passalora fulva TaxID=5499 RepID=A0A9Q8UVQ5_PASFU|nr:uncharacterized protein CLAFUR5_13462 [Fulvia fulva]KAK4610250.1 hypothetical protein CLAFUR4_13613 [Fulvia fulva]KAK4611052.1 hypothetical protein CLAFUR0_13617 [Fulvia fulva]UJO24218.1 hypothetical protein CLAFUR5_13462 [Fulvia fulva]WPV21904.1 hypothetical protein CLAFUW4_13610 [Fulvia fulva]WPV36693.1 hypothetical protein CLAFUW7_13618 [Fulvia fulva]
MAQPPTTTMTKCYLLSIPPELRLEIYDNCLADFDIGYIGSAKLLDHHRKTLKPTLLNICQQVRDEALPLYKRSLEKKRSIEATEADEKWQAARKDFGAEPDVRKAEWRHRCARERNGKWADRDGMYVEELRRVREHENREMP